MSIASDHAYQSLGVTPEAVARGPQITPQLRMIAHTLKRYGQPKVTSRVVSQNNRTGVSIIDDTTHHAPYGPGSDLNLSWPAYLHACDGDEPQRVLDAYYSIARSTARQIPIEAFCLAAGVSPIRILELITAAIVRMGAQASTIIAAVNHPRVVQKTIEMALTDDGTEDRATLHKATGFLPTPKSAQTNISVVTSASAASQSTAQSAAIAPPPEQTIRKLVDRFNDARKLSAPAQSALPESTGSVSIPSPIDLPRAVPSTIELTLDPDDPISQSFDEEEEDMSDG